LQDEGHKGGPSRGYGIDEALKFFRALEKRAAFVFITKSAHKCTFDMAAYAWTTEMLLLSQKNHHKLQFTR